MLDKLAGEKLGDLLVKAGVIDELQLQAALGHQRRWGHKIGKCLIDLGFLEEADLLKFLGDKFKIKAVDLSKSVITEQTFTVVQEAVARKYGVVPVFIKEGPGAKKTVILAMSDPTDLKVVDEIQFLTGYRVEPVLATESAINKVLEHYGKAYRPESVPQERKRETARPSDLRKEHQKEEEKPPDLESIEEGDDELLLGGGQVEEILDLKEAAQEGIEITPDDEVKLIKDEVVMLRADKPRPKGTKVGSSTERIPMRVHTRDEFKAAPKPKPQPPQPLPRRPETPPRPTPPPQAPELSLAPPEIDLGAKQGQTKPEAAKEKPAPAKPIEPIEIPEHIEEEKLELAQAHEFIHWQAEDAPELEKLTAEPTAEPEEKISATSPPAQKEIRLVKPESADEDFWQETSEPAVSLKAPAAESEIEDRLSFEKPLEPPPPPPPPASAPAEKPGLLGSLEELAGEQGEKESEIYSATPAREMAEPEPSPGIGPVEEVGEMSLEFALKTIKELKEEVRQREFQFDELLNLMMKKEIGEITTEIYMRELNSLKEQIEKISRKKE